MSQLDFVIDQAINALDRQLHTNKVLNSLTEKDEWQKQYWIEAAEFWADSVQYWTNEALTERQKLRQQELEQELP